MAHLTVVADSHLSADAPEAVANWDAVLEHVDAARPDLVVHVGDASLDGERNPADLHFARAQLDRLPVPYAVVPGNHDVGDIATASGATEDLITTARCDAWADALGAGHWDVDLGSWRVVGVNAQLFGSGLPAEEAQWAWMERCLAGGDARHRALVIHKPVAASPEEQEHAPRYRFIPEVAQARLATLTKDAPLRVVFSGHVHQSRQLTFGATLHAWAPTTWSVLPESMQATIGGRRCGVLDVELRDDGEVTIELLEPPGMTQLMIGHNTPDHYAH